MAKLADSGERREFGTGAVRDLAEGKGRMDLVPLDVAASFLEAYTTTEKKLTFQKGAALVLQAISKFIDSCRSDEPQPQFLYMAMVIEAQMLFPDPYTALIEVSKQYEDGAKKYSDRNWEKGISVHCYIDSATRHLMKVGRNDPDDPEPVSIHSRATLWNLFSLAWTIKHKPELLEQFINELSFKE